MQGTRGQVGHVKQYLVDGVVPLSGRKLFVMVNFLNVTGWFFPML